MPQNNTSSPNLRFIEIILITNTLNAICFKIKDMNVKVGIKSSHNVSYF